MRSVRDVGNERELPRPLDGRLQRALVRRADTRDAPRLNLAALRNERREQLHVAVADVVDLLDAELAHAPAPEERAARAALAPVLVARRAAPAAAPAPILVKVADHRSPPARKPA